MLRGPVYFAHRKPMALFICSSKASDFVYLCLKWQEMTFLYLQFRPLTSLSTLRNVW